MHARSLPYLLLLLLLSHMQVVRGSAEVEHRDSTSVAGYINLGTDHHMLISKVDVEDVSQLTPIASDEVDIEILSKDDDKPEPPTHGTDNEATENSPIFNLDNLLDLMAGDDNGDVNFNAIVSELTSNLGNVIDINEVGNMAATLGIMMSGMGAVAELQRQGVLDNDVDNGANNVLNSGIAALVGQMLADQRLPELLNGAASASGSNGLPLRASGGANNIGANLDGLGIAQLLNNIASNGETGDANVLGLNQLVGNFASAYAQGGNSKQGDAGGISNLVNNIAAGAQGGNIADTIGSVMAGGGARSVAGALADFVNGNDSANI
ncbi:hypothetical protein GGF38_001108, partial [Coemansia sp. RSA 25]